MFYRPHQFKAQSLEWAFLKLVNLRSLVHLVTSHGVRQVQAVMMNAELPSAVRGRPFAVSMMRPSPLTHI